MKIKSLLIVGILSVMCSVVPVSASSSGSEVTRRSPEELLEEESKRFYDGLNSGSGVVYDNVAEEDNAGGVEEDVSDSFVDVDFEKDVREEIGIGKEDVISAKMCAQVRELNLGSKVKYLDGIENFSNMQKLTIHDASLKKSLSVKNYPSLKSLVWLDVRGSYVGYKLDFTGMSKLRVFQADDCDGIDVINFKGCKSLKQIYVRNVPGMSAIKNTPLGVEVLDMSDCDVDNFTCNDYPNLRYLWTRGSIESDVRGMKKLEYLDCSSTYYEGKLTIKNCPNLKTIVASEGYNKKMEVSNLKSCTNVDCSSGKIKSLVIKNCPSMRFVDCRDNKIYNISISGSSNIDNLKCSGNILRSLDVSTLPNLADLDCTQNYMSGIDKVVGRSASMQEESHRFFFSPQKELKENLISCKSKSLSLKVGKSGTKLKLTGVPAGSVTKYRSSKPSVCRVDSDGNVTPIKKGKANIEITNNGGYNFKSKKITVPVKVVKTSSLGKVKKVKVSLQGDSTAKVSWSKVPKATGYTVMYSYSKNFASFAKVDKSDTNVVLYGVPDNKKVYVKVRPIIESDKFTDYGSWSKRFSS